MYILCRSSVGRRVPLLVPFSRSNSTASAPEEPAPSTPKPSSARIASSWGDIVIPSREEILRKSKVPSYKPDLSYLASEASSGLAGRLAANLTSSPTTKASDGAQIPPLAIYETPEEKTARLQALATVRRKEREARERAANLAREAEEAAQAAENAARAAATENLQKMAAIRRSEREAREHAANLAREAEEAAKAAEIAADTTARAAASEKSALLADQRRAERLRREAAMTPRQRLAYDASLAEAGPESRSHKVSMTPRQRLALDASLGEARPKWRQEPRTSQVSSAKARSASKPSRFPRKPKFRVQSMPSQDSNLANAKDDITLEIIENGGDDKEPPEFTIPDVSFTDFGNLFRPSFERSVETMIRSPEASFSPGQIRILRDNYGGDYQRLASQTSEDSVTPPPQLGPLKHAQSVLSRRSDVSTRARINALDIISAAVGGTASARTTKAIVN